MKNAKLKFNAIAVGLITIPGLIQAQSTVVANKSSVPDLFFNPSFYLLSFVLLILFVVIISLTNSMRLMTYALLPEDQKLKLSEQRKKKAEAVASEGSFFERFDRKVLTKAVPVEKEADVMLDHDYDGIRELDNSLPPWWVWGFYITIIWAFVYLIHYHVFHTGPSSSEEYAQSLETAHLELIERQAKMANFLSPENVKALTTPDGLGAGKGIFEKNCVACHGSEGEGIVGPNLTDDFWIHGGGIKNIFRVITNGVPAKGMISWKSQLTPKQIQQVSSYILTFQGSNPANGKAPQGEKWVDAAVSPTDSSSSFDTLKVASSGI